MDVSAENTYRLATHPQYRQIAVVIYSCVLFVGVLDYVNGRPPTSSLEFAPNTRLTIFCIAVVSMGLLEFINQRGTTTYIVRSSVHLVLMLCLSCFALLVSNGNYSQLLLLTPILFAELTFPRWVSGITMLSAVAFFYIYTWLDHQRNFLSPMVVQSVLVFAVLMLLIWLLANLIKREWSNRLHLQAVHSELKESSTQLAHMAVVQERNRMAREIHDSVGHHLAAVSIQLEMAAKLHGPDPVASVAAIEQAKAATYDALHDVRQSVGALRQSAETFTLVPAVELLIGRIATDQLAINYRLDGDETLYPQPVRLVFFRAIQEGLTNIYKHAAASHVNLWLQFLPQQARLRIVDDGKGFDTHAPTIGNGLKGVRERVEQLGGTVVIESRLSEGTVLDIVLPQSV